MKNKWTTMAIAIAASCVVATAAHTGAQERPSGTSNDITVTGCVRDAAGMSGANSSTTTATTSTTGSASTTGESYVLTNATMGSADAAARSETATTATGTTGSTAAAMGTTYVLEGHESDLKKHVGHRIEVTGTTTAKSDKDATTSTGTTTSATTTTDKADGSASGTRLHVSSIRMISADCSRSGQ